MTKRQFGSKDFSIEKRETVWSGFFKVERLTLKHKLFNGGWVSGVIRELFVRTEAAAVLLYDPRKNKLVFVEQFRVGALELENGPWCLELVAGIADKNESIESLIHREAEEEAGCTIQALEPIYHYMVSPGGTNETLQLFLGIIDSDGVGGVHGLEEEHEDIKVHVLSFEEAKTLMYEGRLNNAASLIAFQWLLLNKNDIDQRW